MYFDFVEMQIKDNKRSTQKLCTLSTQNGIVWLFFAVTSVLEFVNRIENSINVKLECERGVERKLSTKQNKTKHIARHIGSIILSCMWDKESDKHHYSKH